MAKRSKSCRKKNPAQLVILGNPRRRRKKPNAGNGHKASCSCPICKNMRGANAGKSKRRGNSEESRALAKYEEFHGRQPDKILSRQRSAAMRADYVSLGPLLAVAPFVTGMGIPSPDHWDAYPHLKFEKDVKLAMNADGTQLYAIGGNQDCSAVLGDFQGVDKNKDLVTLGELAFVVYLARKQPDPTHPTEYMHKFGVPRPQLGYDQVKQEIFFIGGSYQIREWIEG
jgi:hypothetical protein